MFDQSNKIMPEDARDILKKYGLDVSLEEAKLIVEYLYIFVGAVLQNYKNLEL